jgi:predicted DNA-binding antitoxin AbrB/MazE fold protein
MTEIEAIYHNGKLELKTPLPLAEGQSVRIIVVDEELDRIAAMEAAADAWLKLQPEQQPTQPDANPDWAMLDAEWDELFAEIAASNVDENELTADIEEAVKAVRQRSGE